MKRKILTTTLIVFLTAMNLFAQEEWITQESGTDKILYSVDFINANKGIAVGEAGTILKTNDGGLTWQNITTSITNDLKGVSFYDENHAVAVGSGGQIIVSENGGNNWTSHWLPGIQINLYAVDISADGKGIAAGQQSTMLYTTDGGLNWSVIQEQVPGFCQSVSCYNDSVTFVFGSGIGPNRIYKLVNNLVTNIYNFYVDYGSENWEGSIFDGYVFDEESIVTVGRITRYPSLVGNITSNQELTAPVWESCFTLDSCEFRGVDFIGNYGIAVGGIDLGPEKTVIVETNDGGTTWIDTYNTDGKSPNLKDVKLIGNVAYAVGNDGIIMKKVTGTHAVSHDLSEPSLSIAPNPAADQFEISITLSSPEFVSIDIYDMNGRLINTPYKGKLGAGNHRITTLLTATSGIAPKPGVYIIRLLAGNTVTSAKLIIR